MVALLILIIVILLFIIFICSSKQSSPVLKKDKNEFEEIVDIVRARRRIDELERDNAELKRHIRQSEKILPTTWMVREAAKVAVFDNNTISWILPTQTLCRTPYGDALHKVFLAQLDKKFFKKKSAPVYTHATNVQKR